jgi:hypothetical protein
MKSMPDKRALSRVLRERETTTANDSHEGENGGLVGQRYYFAHLLFLSLVNKKEDLLYVGASRAATRRRGLLQAHLERRKSTCAT